jgi:hypothetical protein
LHTFSIKWNYFNSLFSQKKNHPRRALFTVHVCFGSILGFYKILRRRLTQYPNIAASQENLWW